MTAHGELLVAGRRPARPARRSRRARRAPTTIEVGAGCPPSACVEGDEVDLVLTVRARRCRPGDGRPGARRRGPRRGSPAGTRDGAPRVRGGRWCRPAGAATRSARCGSRSPPAAARTSPRRRSRSATSSSTRRRPPWPAPSRRTSWPRRSASTPAGPSAPASSSPGVRPYAHGDRQRDVDWRTSARHGDLFVRQYAAERAFDLVLVLDTAVDAGEPGRSQPGPHRPGRDRAGPDLPAVARPGRPGHLRRAAALAGARRPDRGSCTGCSEALMAVRPDADRARRRRGRVRPGPPAARDAAAPGVRRAADPAARRRPARGGPADARRAGSRRWSSTC